jgi:hypothetical protein
MVLIHNKGSQTASRTGAIYLLIQADSRWKLRNRSGQLYTPRGSYNFVRRNGVIRVCKRGEHVHISRGLAIEYAGEVRFGYNTATRGQLRWWSNASGHYLPAVDLAPQAGFPMDLFKAI